MSGSAPARSCGLYLAVIAGRDSALVERLRPLIAGGEISCLLIEASSDGSIDRDVASALCAAAQDKGIATLVRDDIDAANAIKADGVHVSWDSKIISRYRDTRDVLGSDKIIGADVGRSRHDAMTLGDSGTDYVAFGVPSHVQDVEKARARQLDLVEWWGDIFEVPCVAFDVTALEHGRELAKRGADFVVFDLPDGISGADLTAWLDKAASALVEGVADAAHSADGVSAGS